VREIREETALDVRALYSADLCEQFYEISNDSIWIAPVFVAFVGGESRVVTNEEHSEHRWCTITEGVALLTFPGAGHILQTVDSHFVAREPNPFLRIAR
jgi:dATP pyrophosphohydrolase